MNSWLLHCLSWSLSSHAILINHLSQPACMTACVHLWTRAELLIMQTSFNEWIATPLFNSNSMNGVACSLPLSLEGISVLPPLSEEDSHTVKSVTCISTLTRNYGSYSSLLILRSIVWSANTPHFSVFVLGSNQVMNLFLLPYSALTYQPSSLSPSACCHTLLPFSWSKQLPSDVTGWCPLQDHPPHNSEAVITFLPVPYM